MSLHNTEPSRYDDEIDLFELWDILWAKKYLVLAITLLSGLAGLLYATYHLGKPERHIGEVMLEIGSYTTASAGTQYYDTANDLAAILNQRPGIKAESPRGTTTILELKSTHVDESKARQQLEQAIAYLLERHQAIAEKLPESQRLSMSRPVTAPTYRLDSPKNKRPLVTALAIILGGMVSMFIVFFGNAISKRREQANSTADN